MKVPISDAQRDAADRLSWFHSLEFGDCQTVGRFNPPFPPNVTLFGVMDLLNGIDVTGMRCLDVGPAHGLISFGLALRGAFVTAINIGGAKPPQISLAEEIYGVDLDYISPLSLEQSPNRFAAASFDLIICAGVMYHLLNPADVFFRLRPLLKRNGLLLMETVFAHDQKDPVFFLNTESGSFRQPTTYFLPSASALTGIAKLACFDVLATRVNSPIRFSLLGRAAMPEEVSDRTDFCQLCHETGFEDPLFSIANLAGALTSEIQFRGERGHKLLDVMSFTPDFPSHPKCIVSPVGSRILPHLKDSKL